MNPPSDHFIVEWIDSGREPQCEPDPKYPNGIDIDAPGMPTPNCTVTQGY